MLITRVVDSMVSNPRPTRAEATGVCGGGLDGMGAVYGCALGGGLHEGIGGVV